MCVIVEGVCETHASADHGTNLLSEVVNHMMQLIVVASTFVVWGRGWEYLESSVGVGLRVPGE